MPIESVIYAVFAPGIGAGIVLLIIARPWRKRDDGPAVNIAMALAVGAAVLASFFVMVGWPGVAPEVKWHWLAPTILAATLLGAAASEIRKRAFFGGLAVVAAVVTGLLFRTPGSVEQPWLWKSGLAAVATLLAFGMLPLRNQSPGFVLPTAVMSAGVGASIVILQSNFATGALIAAAFAAVMGCVAAIVLWNPKTPMSAGAIIVSSITLPTLAAIGRLWTRDFSETPAFCFALIAGAPLGAWLMKLAPAKSPAWVRATLGVLGPAAIVGAAIAFAMMSGGEEPYEF